MRTVSAVTEVSTVKDSDRTVSVVTCQPFGFGILSDLESLNWLVFLVFWPKYSRYAAKILADFGR